MWNLLGLDTVFCCCFKFAMETVNCSNKISWKKFRYSMLFPDFFFFLSCLALIIKYEWEMRKMVYWSL